MKIEVEKHKKRVCATRERQSNTRAESSRGNHSLNACQIQKMGAATIEGRENKIFSEHQTEDTFAIDS